MEAIGEQLPLRIAVELAAETAGVLAAVLGGTPDDDALVIHPGVGPEQVLMDDGGNVKLVGFVFFDLRIINRMVGMDTPHRKGSCRMGVPTGSVLCWFLC